MPIVQEDEEVIIEVVVGEGGGVDEQIITGLPVGEMNCLIEEDIIVVAVIQHGMMKGECNKYLFVYTVQVLHG